ncbi:MAG: D-alanyl-D-alanine carboxypeptidase [Lachnospiraceae bacterium]|nr:D-alanyl-D-alanine carboxypeptidase [Lachnospiraceae bacterium]
MKGWKKWIAWCLVCLVSLSGFPVSAQVPAETELYAKAAVLMDADSGRVLFEKNGQEILAMASTTKIMTCILALENADLDEMVDISAYAASMPKVRLGVKKGEQYRLGDLLYSLMLESHNDVAVAIAEHMGQDFLRNELQQKSVADFSKEESKEAVAAFADLMNEKARELGCEDSWFITPNGLDATETFTQKDGTTFEKYHSTTATDLATIMSYCVRHSPKKDAFLKITQTVSYSLSSGEGRNFFCTNHNAFLAMMEGAISGKTGFTNKAGYCYVGALEQEGKTYIVALLACGWPNNKSFKWSDTKKLMKHGIEDFEYQAFADIEEVEIPKKVPVINGQTAFIGQQAYVETQIIPAEPEENVFGALEGVLLGEGEKVEIEYDMVSALRAPVQKGEVIGSIRYEVNGKCFKCEEVIVTAEIPEINLEWCVNKVLEQYFEVF